MFQSSFLFRLFERKKKERNDDRYSLLEHQYNILPSGMDDYSDEWITDDDKLCNDVLMLIFSYLEPRDIIRVSRVDKRWHHLSKHDYVWNRRRDIFDESKEVEEEEPQFSNLRELFLDQMKYFSYIFKTNKTVKRIRFWSFFSLHLFFVGMFVSIVTLSFMFEYGSFNNGANPLVDDKKWYNWVLLFIPGIFIMFPFVVIFFLCNIYETDFLLMKRQDVLLRASERGFIGYKTKKFYSYERDGNIISMMNLVQMVMCVFLVYAGILLSLVLNGAIPNSSATLCFVLPAVFFFCLYAGYLCLLKSRRFGISYRAVIVYLLIYLYFTIPVIAVLILFGLKMDQVLNLHTQSFYVVFFVFSGTMCAGIVYSMNVLVRTLSRRFGLILSFVIAGALILIPVFLLIVTYLLFQLQSMGVLPKILVVTLIPFWLFMGFIIMIVLCSLDVCQLELYCRE